MGAVALENQRLQLINHAETGNAPGDASLSNRIAALRELTLTLLREVEALGGNPAHEIKRGINLQDEVRRFEIDLIRYALRQTGGHQVRAARLLGMKVTTLNSKIIRYHIDPDEVAGKAAEPRPFANVSALEQR
jgi:DNA-binding NtrC family response regulator